ncbi:MAG: hypothetical protein JWO21_1590 [Solirubrobacterales bacterium]|jgi:hypothetical protein|nr:hypothetical protein [Solirubrobacterales bacterium]
MSAMPAASLYDVVLAIHIMAVVVAFGVTFAYPIMFLVAARHEARGVPLLHRIEYTTERWLVNPGLLVILLAGVYLASEGHHWSEFFVQWGLGTVVVIGAVLGTVMIPSAKRAEALAERDVLAAGEGLVEPSAEYEAVVRRLTIVGSLLSLLVLVTILFMTIKP